MPHWIAIALRGLALVTGMFCLYIAIFMYETEQGKLQNFLEDLWVRIEDLRLAAMSSRAAFLRVVAGATADAFDRLFSQQLLSLRAWAVSASFSLASLCLVIGYG